jgi:hypothetical protein
MACPQCGVGRSATAEQTLYLTASSKAGIAERADRPENDRIKDDAEDQATQIMLDRYRAEWEAEWDMIIAAVCPPDHASLWED